MSGLNKVMLEKPCRKCGQLFTKNPRDSYDQWDERAYCSTSCNSQDSEIPIHIRFWDYAQPTENNSCWNWAGPKDSHGYGFLAFKARNRKAHRISYEMRFGPIPDGLNICHICDNPSCVNPAHLFAATQGENARDMARKGRINPKSHLNLKPGREGFHGAGPLSNKEIANAE